MLLYIELDKADPIIEDLLPFLSHKVPKTITATLTALTAIFHAYGCKIINPRPVLALLPKVYGHADKNVRAEAQSLTVELYRWLREGMKPMFWGELKPMQQTDLEKLFEKVKDEPAPKQERLLRSQQAAAARTAADGGGAEEEEEAEEEAEGAFEPELMAINVFPKIPKDFHDRLGSTKWKDRKEALDELHTAINVPAIEEGSFDEIVRGLAKSMKDANIAVVTVAANCVELLAKGLRRSFAKYRSIIFNPIIERLKERKQTVTDALAGALDAVCASTSIQETLEDTIAALSHKNPLVKLEATRFLIRNLKTTREAPSIPDVKTISDACVKLLGDSQDNQRTAAAEVLGVLLRIMGDRIMNVHLDPLDDIRKAKVKECCDAAEVKAKYKPKAAAPAKAAPAPAAGKKPVGKRPAGMVQPKKAVARAPSPSFDEAPPSPAPRPTAKPGLKTPTAGGARGLKPPGGTVRKLAAPGSLGPASSPKRAPAPPMAGDESPPPPPKPASRGLAGRQLAKPAAPVAEAPLPQRTMPATAQPLPSIERIELDELRAESERLRNSNETLRTEQLKLSSQVTELQNQNAQLIEDHTRDVLSIKAKETQLVRARSDAEAAEQNATSLQREVERLKRELGRMGRAQSPRTTEYGAADIFAHSSMNGPPGTRASVAVPPTAASSYREGKENAFPYSGQDKEGRVLSPPLRADASAADMRAASASPRRAAPRPHTMQSMPPPSTNGSLSSNGVMSDSDARSSATSASSAPGRDGEGNGEGVESWKRAAEVTQNLKARIELMKQRQQGMRRN